MIFDSLLPLSLFSLFLSLWIVSFKIKFVKILAIICLNFLSYSLLSFWLQNYRHVWSFDNVPQINEILFIFFQSFFFPLSSWDWKCNLQIQWVFFISVLYFFNLGFPFLIGFIVLLIFPLKENSLQANFHLCPWG